MTLTFSLTLSIYFLISLYILLLIFHHIHQRKTNIYLYKYKHKYKLCLQWLNQDLQVLELCFMLVVKIFTLINNLIFLSLAFFVTNILDPTMTFLCTGGTHHFVVKNAGKSKLR